jgi:hypothetical protein
MALQINNPFVGAALQELFRLQGRVQPQLDQFIVPTVQVADLSVAASPPVIRSCVSANSIAAVVGQAPSIIFNVPGGVLAIIKSLRFQVQATTNFQVNVGNSSLSGPATASARTFMDGRINRSQEPVCTMVVGTQAAQMPSFEYRCRVVANTELVIVPSRWVLGRGTATDDDIIEFQFGDNDMACDNFSMEWTEHPLA